MEQLLPEGKLRVANDATSSMRLVMRCAVIPSSVCTAGEGLRRLEYRIGKWDRDLAAYLKLLRERKPIVVCGDLNCAHHEIDIHSPKTNL